MSQCASASTKEKYRLLYGIGAQSIQSETIQLLQQQSMSSRCLGIYLV